MKIEYVDKFDLYKRGNYIGSFDKYDEILKYFEDKYKTCSCGGYGWTSEYFCKIQNDEVYSVIQSKHLKFS